VPNIPSAKEFAPQAVRIKLSEDTPMRWQQRFFFTVVVLTATSIQAEEHRKNSRTPLATKSGATLRTQERDWTDASGKRRTRATLVSVENGVARFRRHDGRSANMTIAKLSAADQDFIAKWNRVDEPSGLAKMGKSFADALTTWPSKSLDLKESAEKQLQDAKATLAPPLPANAIYVRISEELLQRQLSREITRQMPVAENILGTNTYGHAHVVGKPQIHLLPGQMNGAAEIRFIGHVHSRTTGRNGPIQIHSHSDTAFSAVARLTLSPTNLTASAVTTRAKTNSTIDNMTTSLPRLRGRIALAIARRRAAEQLPIAERIAADRAATKISREFDQIVATRVKKISEIAAAQLTGLRGDGHNEKDVPQVQISSTEDYLQVVAVWPDAAPWTREPKRLAHRPDVEVHVHRAAVNSTLAEINSTGSAKPAIFPISLSRWALNVALPRRGNAAAGVFNGRPQLDVTWSDDSEWLQLSWHGEQANPHLTPRTNTTQFAERPAVGRNNSSRVATSPRTMPR
jgi:hypothetical protein